MATRHLTTVMGIVLLLCAGSSWAQPASLITDRPDITESSTVVGWGRFQIETSAQWQTFGFEGLDETVFSTPTLVRIGLNRALEFRIETDALTSMNRSVTGAPDTDFTGYSPIAVGGKLHLLANNAGTRSAGLLVHVEVPSGSSEFKTDDTAVTIIVAADWDLADGLGLGVNAGADVFDGADGDPLTGGAFSAALGYDVADGVGAFLEFAASGMGLVPEHRTTIIDGGVTYEVNPDFQLDLAFGSGLTPETGPDFFVTFGVSVRGAYLR
jgi:hypothetical protein